MESTQLNNYETELNSWNIVLSKTSLKETW